MNPPKDIPHLLIKDLIDNQSLTGLFYVPERIYTEIFYARAETFVYLKNSVLHNDDGPFHVIPNHDGSFEIYFHEINKPFSALGFKYPNHPTEIRVKSADLIKDKFVYSPEQITQFDFYLPESNKNHNIYGPASVYMTIQKTIKSEYHIMGRNYSKDQFEEKTLAIIKDQVLKVISAS